jgi:hypothetical protein
MLTPDLARIAFVTRAYPRMRVAILNIGAGPILIWWLRYARGENLGMATLAIVTLVACVWALHQGPARWLDRRFGRVLPDEPTSGWNWRSQLPVLAGVLIWRAESWAQRTGGPPVFMLALTVLSLRTFVRDWVYRPYTVIFTLVCALSSAVLIAEHGNPDILAWRMRTDAAAILAWMLVGVCDLITLFRVMPHRADAREHESHADSL